MALNNQGKLDGLADGRFIWQQQIPLNKGDKAFHGTRHSAEHLLYLAKYHAQAANTRAARLEKAVASQNATISNLVSGLAAVSKGEPFDEQKLLNGISSTLKSSHDELLAAIAPAVQAALEGFDISEEVRAAVMGSVESITTTTTAQIKEQP